MRAILAFAALAVVGCRSAAATEVERDPTPHAPATAPSAAPLSAQAGAEPDAAQLGEGAPVGGRWLQCYATFVPRTQPESDVARLTEACGAPNGMLPLSPPRAARVREAGRGRDHEWRSEAGRCYRIFAVGAPSIEDLDLEVFAPGGERVAFDTSDDRWPIAQADGPFCAFEAGRYRARVRAERGSGEYAIQILAQARPER